MSKFNFGEIQIPLNQQDMHPVENFNVDSNAFYPNMLLLGTSGSGKTQMCKRLCRHTIQDGGSVIVFDVKGDFAVGFEESEIVRLIPGVNFTASMQLFKPAALCATLEIESSRKQDDILFNLFLTEKKTKATTHTLEQLKKALFYRTPKGAKKSVEIMIDAVNKKLESESAAFFSEVTSFSKDSLTKNNKINIIDMSPFNGERGVYSLFIAWLTENLKPEPLANESFKTLVVFEELNTLFVEEPSKTTKNHLALIRSNLSAFVSICRSGGVCALYCAQHEIGLPVSVLNADVKVAFTQKQEGFITKTLRKSYENTEIGRFAEEPLDFIQGMAAFEAVIHFNNEKMRGCVKVATPRFYAEVVAEVVAVEAVPEFVAVEAVPEVVAVEAVPEVVAVEAVTEVVAVEAVSEVVANSTALMLSRLKRKW
jgi:GTPase SAR1 family protein